MVLYAIWKEVKPINNKTLWEQMQYLIAKNVYNDYWFTSVNKYGKNPDNSPFHYAATYYHTITDYGWYTDKHGQWKYGYYSVNERSYYAEKLDLGTTSNNGKNIATQVTSFFIDFLRASDGSLNLPNGESSYWGNANKYRVHSLFNINTTYKTRAGYNDDPLYCRIEAEPYNESTPVRQFVINVNVDNTADNLRPLFFYYDGPSEGMGGADAAQPVILNLNANFKGVIFMPEIPVVINGNGYRFEGFIVAKEFRYLDRKNGTPVGYSSTGKTDKNYSDNKIRVDTSTGDVYSVLATGNNAMNLFDYNATDKDRFNLSPYSTFRTFSIENEVKYMYVFYDYNWQLDPTPFYDNYGDLIPLYKIVNGKQVRVTKWEDVKLYDKPRTDSTRQEIPKELPHQNSNMGIVRLTDGSPSPLYDEAGNPVYFCEDYVNLTGTYNVFTLDRVADNTRDPKEFLLTKTYTTNVSNTDDWK